MGDLLDLLRDLVNDRVPLVQIDDLLHCLVHHVARGHGKLPEVVHGPRLRVDATDNARGAVDE
eukprot:5902948-Lingulodinium_polyedra.AAC.1